MGIAEFLEARWGEAEYHAKVALLRAKPPWSSSETPESGPPGAVSLYDADDDNFAIIRGSYLADYLKRFDPAAVLADIEAKRAILDLWQDPAVVRDLSLHPDHPHDGRDPDEIQAQVAAAEAIDDVVRLLAALLAAHPDYDQAWRPGA